MMVVDGGGQHLRFRAVALEERRTGVVVMEICMPELNGAKATELIKRDCPETKVLALTVHNDQGYLHQLLKAGASGYVLKRAAAHELIQAIRVVAAGDTYLDPTLNSNVAGSYIRKQSATERLAYGDLSDH